MRAPAATAQPAARAHQINRSLVESPACVSQLTVMAAPAAATRGNTMCNVRSRRARRGRDHQVTMATGCVTLGEIPQKYVTRHARKSSTGA